MKQQLEISLAMVTHKTGSEIDLSLCGEEALTLDILYRIMEDLGNLLLSCVDLSIFNHIKDEDVIAHIRRVGSAFYNKR